MVGQTKSGAIVEKESNMHTLDASCLKKVLDTALSMNLINPKPLASMKNTLLM
jgi:hypothetical protein